MIATLFVPFFAAVVIDDSAPITLAEAKAYLRVESTDEDETITDLIRAAAMTIEGMTGRVCRTREFVSTYAAFKPRMALCKAPAVSVSAVEYIDVDGVPTVVDSGAYALRQFAGAPIVSPVAGVSWPVAEADTVTVTFTAGYPDNAAVDARIRTTARLMIGHWYRNRDTIGEPPMAVLALLSDLRLADLA